MLGEKYSRSQISREWRKPRIVRLAEPILLIAQAN